MTAGLRDVPHRGRQAAQGDARCHRRRHRQRRRTASQRLRAHQHQAGLLAGRAARASCPTRPLKALESTRIQGVPINLRLTAGRVHATDSSTGQAADKNSPASRNDPVAGTWTRRVGWSRSAGPSALPSLTGIRAVAAMLVVATHAAYTTGKYNPRLRRDWCTRAWRSACRSSSCCPGFCCSGHG